MTLPLYDPAPQRPVASNTALTVPDLPEGMHFPLVCRWPEGDAPKGYAIFCHGLGASGRDYAKLSERWARGGYLVIHPTFADSVEAVVAADPALAPGADLERWTEDPRLRQRLYEALHSAPYWVDRIRIVRGVLDRLETIVAATCGPQAAPLRGAIAGHSFGAYTAQLLAGAEVDLPGEGPAQFREGRFSAAILLSAQGRDQQGLRAGSWDGIEGPMLNVTGTRDGGAKGQDWHWKTEPYDLAPPGDKYLAVLEGADHFLGGIARPNQSPAPAQGAAVRALTLAFLDTYLADEAEAKAWLASADDQMGECGLIFARK
ncbi:alpha/beta hydrolase family protein [Acidimangrovimonas sediminis]|uniref:alpha/beta hydrolase family protein n=1 Tax=Acidimangrovimonas sediminis TaxID=2056283 RepID=UPI000C80477F|nr:hypothetical protein [Acidimangrovimonas sediminis]